MEVLLNQYFPNTFYRTSSETGSFIEFLEAGNNGLEILKIFIQLLGITVPIVYTEIREKRKKKLTETPVISKNVEVNVSLAQNEKNVSELIQNTCQLINSSNLLNNSQQGYNNKNIQEITIEYNINIQV